MEFNIYEYVNIVILSQATITIRTQIFSAIILVCYLVNICFVFPFSHHLPK